MSDSQKRADWIHHQGRIAVEAMAKQPPGIKRYLEENRQEAERLRERSGPTGPRLATSTIRDPSR
ncbi:MAG: hypothetical protein RID91_09705 [Azospirillaceae bacterium]